MMIKLIANMVSDMVSVTKEFLCFGLHIIAYAFLGKVLAALIAAITGVEKMEVLAPILPLVLFFTIYVLFALSIIKKPIQRF